ncbi:NAD(P)/FAD-dependent oxidoreductase [Mycetocola sp.]|uniref:NAD(P)/FAD-dependent oxidoreductase n=1 Tax=Mycetocola sp. TaxID=1871042 RepID=UPI0039892F82
MSPATNNIIIVGASVAGISAADALRDGGFEGEITVLSDERHLPYDRPPLSKSLLATDGDSPPAQALRPGPDAHFEANRIDLRLGVGAAGLDIDRRYVITTDGAPLPYDAVVIATGSSPRRLVTEGGATLPALRTLDDLATIRSAVDRHRNITVIGCGLIGMEVAASLRERGITVTVVGAGSMPLEATLGRDVAQTIFDLHVEHGVKFILNAAVESVGGVDGDFTVHFADGSVHSTEYVIAGIGVTPNTDWLIGSGVDLADGVVCDASGRTNVPGIYAAGDVANIDSPAHDSRRRIEHWTNALEQGRHVANEILTGSGTPYTVVPYFWTDQYDRKLQVYGHRRPEDSMFVAEGSLESGEFLVLYGDGAAFHAVASVEYGTSLRAYRKMLQRGATWDEAVAHAEQSQAAHGIPAP